MKKFKSVLSITLSFLLAAFSGIFTNVSSVSAEKITPKKNGKMQNKHDKKCKKDKKNKKTKAMRGKKNKSGSKARKKRTSGR
ncbi:MAG: hypothetical protein GY754_45905 [bacterium]|nr:hypothetical protein [bacterium]